MVKAVSSAMAEPNTLQPWLQNQMDQRGLCGILDMPHCRKAPRNSACLCSVDTGWAILPLGFILSPPVYLLGLYDSWWPLEAGDLGTVKPI